MAFKRIAIITVGAVFMATGADAALLTGSSPGFHYFWKPGATMDDHDAALVDCAVRLRAMVNGSNAMDSSTAATSSAAAQAGSFAGGAAVGLAGALFGGIIDNNENRQGAAANTEGCMAIKGWSVVALTEEEGRAMEQPDEPAAIRERLRRYVEAASASGPVLRGPFANELASGNFEVDTAKDLEEVSMSVRASRDKADAAVTAAGKLKPPKPDLPEAVKMPKKIKPMKSEELIAAGPDHAFVAIRIVGRKNTMAKSTSLIFQRLQQSGAEVVYDGAPSTIEIGPKVTNKGRVGDEKYEDYVVQAPPGRWKLAGVARYLYGASLCFGAPAFEASVGEVRFLGVMRLRDEGGYPLTADLAVPGEMFVSNPALSEKVKAAEWTNGFTADCFGSYAYAYEVLGAPFVDMNALARSTPAGDAPDAAPVEGANGAGAETPSENLVEAPITEATPSAPAPEPAAAPDTISSEDGAEQ